MRRDVISALKHIEKKLNCRLPISTINFLASRKGPRLRFGSEAWEFPVLARPPAPEWMLKETLGFRKTWKLAGVVIANNGLGDLLLLLPATPRDGLSETVCVLLHENAQIRGFAASLESAAASRRLDYIYGDSYFYKLNEDGSVSEDEDDEQEQVTKATRAVARRPPARATNEALKAWIDDVLLEPRFDASDALLKSLARLAASSREASVRSWAHLKLAQIHAEGFGHLQPDHALASKHNLEAIALGSAQAFSMRANWHFEGHVLPTDLKAAYSLLLSARAAYESNPNFDLIKDVIDDKLKALRARLRLNAPPKRTASPTARRATRKTPR